MNLEKYREWLNIYLKGAAMGAADAVPGVSGGTIALITGIYERLIAALSSPDLEKARRGLKYTADLDLQRVKSLLLEMDVPFLLVLGAGIMSSLVLVLNIVHYLIENFVVSTYAFFFGLILASAVILYSEVDPGDRGSQLAAVSGFIFAFIISGLGATSLGHGNLVVFLSGAVAVSAMILPGISGSLILVILGQYDYMSGMVSKATDGLFQVVSTGKVAHLSEAAVPVIVFISGAVTGVLSLVKVVDYAFSRWRKATMAFLVSLMAGALRAPYLEIRSVIESGSQIWASVAPEFAFAAVLGAVLILVIDRKTVDI